MTQNPLRELATFGQSVWLDYIRRDLINSGALQRLIDASKTIDKPVIESFVRDYIEPGTQVVTDGLSVYDGLTSTGFRHCPHVITTGGETARQELDHVHRVISLLKRWIIGTQAESINNMVI